MFIMKTTHRRMSLAWALVFSLAVPAGAGGPENGEGRQTAPVGGKKDKTAEHHVLVRLHFEVLEVKLTAEQIDRINSSAEAVDVNALTTEAIKAGNAEVKHVFDTPLIVGNGVELVTGSRVPIVQGSTFTEAGSISTSISYKNVGCILECETRWAGPRDQSRIAVSCEAEISNVLRDGSVKLNERLGAPIFTTTEQEFDTIVRLGSEMFFSTLWSQRLAPDDQDTRGYVYRIRLTPEDAG